MAMGAEFTLRELARALHATLEGDAAAVVTGVAPLESAGPDQVSFLVDARYVEASVVHARVAVCAGVRLGKRVVIHPGAVIGADGFGYAFDGQAHRKIPQVGSVLVEDDVEIGANTTVDRATLGQTIIRRGTKI